MSLPMLAMPGPMELFIILFIVMILFGAGKLPQVGKSLGSAISEFKKSVNDKEEDEATVKRNETPVDKNETPSA